MKNYLALTLSILSISYSSYAYAFDNSLLGIIFKIYEQATEVKQAVDSIQLPTKTPESFAQSKRAEKGSNLALEGSKSSEGSSASTEAQNSNLTPAEAFEEAQAHHERAVALAKQKREELKNAPKRVDTESELYLQEFNARHLTNKQFVSLYYSRNNAFLRNNVTLANATDREKIALEKGLQFKEHEKKELADYHKAFQRHIKYVVKDLHLSFVELRQLAIKGDPDAQEQFNLNPAGDAILIKNIWAGVTNYEITHPELNTHCLYGLGGKNEYLPDCDKILSIITSKYAKTHKHVNVELSKAELRKIAHAINPHETLD